MSINSVFATVSSIISDLLEFLFYVMLALLVMGVGVVVLGSLAGGTYVAFDYLRNPERYTVSRIIECAKKLYPEYTAFEVKTKRNHDNTDEDLGPSRCSAAVCGTKEGEQSQLMVIERWHQPTLLQDLERKIKETLRRKEAGCDLEAEYEWRVVESA
ncbi:uncharacterized protein EKO05_0007678 [Ascochyta rabiei]|uniref:Uncharacterized protein n=1 Tax=Didymella rabiei TaxID=5454 RepID=A0A162VJJ2_DIDRA|nr:uncharacterized protein EKO05_0007678 [Ascochyta rabiei]KZM18498.1 hypothetical protein ST47_g10369 [Ascochyta rabiei]UPX17313.1 hypothetical protein EKO05_0007678 [Ascochyta rabiei]